MDFIKKITGKKTRKPSQHAQLIALPQAVMIYTEEGTVIVTPKLAEDIQANLAQITQQAKEYKPKKAEKK